jgi:hypothetical protein
MDRRRLAGIFPGVQSLKAVTRINHAGEGAGDPY